MDKQTNKKFLESFIIKNWEVKTESGFKPITHSNKTIEYNVYELELENGLTVKCADTHIFINSQSQQIYAKDSLNEELFTVNGVSKVIKVTNLNYKESMYDLTVDSNEHTYFTNGILSHNTTVATIILLHYALFNKDKRIALLANKGDAAREILDRIQIAFENLPKWMQSGVVIWNKGTIQLENGSRIIAASSSASSIRGKSCVTGDTKITVSIHDDIYYNNINYFMEEKMDKIYYTVYKTTNNINGKIYIGCHKTTNINDGYLGSGTIIKRAIEKYGVENFTKEILKTFDNLKDAESYEAELVDKNFTLREDTYNINVGGNVRIAYGENNGFYGKTHSDEIKQKISAIHQGNKYFAHDILVFGKLIKGYEDAFNYYNTQTNNDMKYTRRTLLNLIGNPEIDFKFVDENLQQRAEISYVKRLQELADNKNNNVKMCSERFKNVPKSIEQREKMSNATKGIPRPWVGELVNKNPDKIAKTAEKHRGMKRTEESRKKMSESSANKGKKFYHSPETLEGGWFSSDDIIPDGYIKGYIKCTKS